MKPALFAHPVRTMEQNPFRTVGVIAYISILLLVKHHGGF